MTDPEKVGVKTEEEHDEPVKSFAEFFGEEYDAGGLDDEPFTTEFIALKNACY